MKSKIKLSLYVFLIGIIFLTMGCQSSPMQKTTSDKTEIKFVVTDTKQSKFYDADGNIIDEPELGDSLYGQDAQYQGILPSYTDNGDGTVTDNNTGLMWQQTPETEKMTYIEAIEYVKNLKLGGYTDWRLPTIKESFSLADMNGQLIASDTTQSTPYIDSEYFDFFYDEDRPYTGSYWTSSVTKIPAENEYEEMEKNYGFNWADGHLKSYGDGFYLDGTSSGASIPAGVRAVRGEEGIFGINDFTDNGDGTITDKATDLMWSQKDSGSINDDGTIRDKGDENFGLGRTWINTLEWVQEMNNSNYLGYSDWRLPNAKELQSIIEYGITELPAVDTNYFELSRENCYMWTSTTCGDFPDTALYFAFGKAYGINLNSEEKTETGVDKEAMRTPPQKRNFSEKKPPMIKQTLVDKADSTEIDATVADFVDTHGPGAMRNDYKDTNGAAIQAPKLARNFWVQLYGEEYPYEYDEANDSTTIFDLSASENAADLIVIYNYALLVRDVN